MSWDILRWITICGKIGEKRLSSGDDSMRVEMRRSMSLLSDDKGFADQPKSVGQSCCPFSLPEIAEKFAALVRSSP